MELEGAPRRFSFVLPPTSRGRRGTSGRSVLTAALPAIVRESLVGLGHAVGVFLLLDRSAAILRGIQELAGELRLHRLLAPLLRALDQPTDREGELAAR